jgi:hypothetical protein
MHLKLAAVIVIAACGGRTPPPATPEPPDPKQLASRHFRDLTELGEIARRLRGKCPELIAALRPHVSRMKLHLDEVKQLQADPELRLELKTEFDAYAERAAGLTDVIGNDLGATYLTCANKEDLTEVIDQIPQA